MVKKYGENTDKIHHHHHHHIAGLVNVAVSTSDLHADFVLDDRQLPDQC